MLLPITVRMSADLADKRAASFAAGQKCVDILTICCCSEATRRGRGVEELRNNYRLEDGLLLAFTDLAKEILSLLESLEAYKFPTKSVHYFSPHLKHVTPLPREVKAFENK